LARLLADPTPFPCAARLELALLDPQVARESRIVAADPKRNLRAEDRCSRDPQASALATTPLGTRRDGPLVSATALTPAVRVGHLLNRTTLYVVSGVGGVVNRAFTA